jgi:hypothetical protein
MLPTEIAARRALRRDYNSPEDHSNQYQGVTFVKKSHFAGVLAAPLLMFAMIMTSHADSMCTDGTTSTATGRGACSGHGGVQKAAKPAPATTAKGPATTETATPAATPAPSAAAAKAAPAGKAEATTGNTDPTGATAKCKDGTYSKSKSHSGACSKHGGVADWLDAK